jgi:AraC-like DNA-binding protein
MLREEFTIHFLVNNFDNSCSSVLSLYQVGAENCAPGHSFGPAVRDHYLIHCVIDGEGVFSVGEKRYSITKGQGFLIHPGVVTLYQADHNNPWKYVWVGFNGADADSICSLCGIGLEQPVFHFSDEDRLKNCIYELGESYRINNNGFLTLSRLYEFFSLIGSVDATSEKTVRLIDLALDFINKNYSYGLTVSQIANHLGISRSHLFRIFKENMDMSVQSYLLSYRLERAESMLKNTDRSVKEIMYSCGFKDSPNFSRQFRSAYGLPPGAYRDAYRERT